MINFMPLSIRYIPVNLKYNTPIFFFYTSSCVKCVIETRCWRQINNSNDMTDRMISFSPSSTSLIYMYVAIFHHYWHVVFTCISRSWFNTQIPFCIWSAFKWRQATIKDDVTRVITVFFKVRILHISSP
jgi:hypothetical protein